MTDALCQITVTPAIPTAVPGAMTMMPMVPVSVFIPISLPLLLFIVATPSKRLEQLMGEFVNGFFKVLGFSARIHRSCLLGGIGCFDRSD